MFAAMLLVLIGAFLLGAKFALDLFSRRRRKHRLHNWPERRYGVDVRSAATANLTAVLKYFERERPSFIALLAHIEKALTALRARATRAKRNLSLSARCWIAAQKARWASWRKVNQKDQSA